jgi:hypothetical protein
MIPYHIAISSFGVPRLEWRVARQTGQVQGMGGRRDSEAIFSRGHPAAAGRDSGRRKSVHAGLKTGTGRATGGIAGALDRGPIELAGGVGEVVSLSPLQRAPQIPGALIPLADASSISPTFG